LQRQPDDHVAHGIAGGGQAVAAHIGHEVIISPAAQDGAKLAVAVAGLEHRAGVIVQPANDARLKLDIVAHAKIGHSIKELGQLGRLLP
jgi:hypothetical protein